MSNVDHAEIDKFSALASRWWDRDSEFKTLHDINPLRLNFIQQHTSVATRDVIDVGCGGGILSEGLARMGGRVTGIDMAEASIRVADLHALDSGLDIHYHVISAEQMASDKAGQFDVVVCMEMLEHVPDPGSIIQACADMLKPGGWAFFSTLNRTLKARLLAIGAAEYVLGMLPKGTHDYAKFITPAEMDRWFRQSDLELRTLAGMSYNPITRQYSLSQDTDVNYLMAVQKVA